MIQKINHVGIAVKDLEKALVFFKNTFGAKVVSKEAYEDHEFVTVLIAIGEAHFEILASSKPGSMIDKYIKTRKEGIHHVSLQVDNFDRTIRDFKKKGLKVIGEIKTAEFKAAEFKAAFIHPADNFGILMEIIELKDKL